MADDSCELRDALDSRLLSTCAARWGSAVTAGRSGAMATRMLSRPPALKKAFRASSTSRAASAGTGVTDSVPVSIRTTSMRSEIKSRM